MEFLTTLEESELALDVGRWVLATAIAQADAWRRQGLDLGISINVSPQHVMHPAFVDELAQLLATHADLPAEKIELEILESAALEDIQHMAEVMKACDQLGVGFALDDFGTGKSSIGDFHRLPAHTLKIDRSFISKMLSDPQDVAVIESIIGLTSAFRRQVVAEGLETAEHGALLLQLGCDLAQGYGIARPMTADQVPDWVRDFNPHPSWAQPAQTFSQPCERNCSRFEMPNIKM
jgi:EAL domain-containing protein (putative c-di-GMP-specific phosphodiesterase class I)